MGLDCTSLTVLAQQVTLVSLLPLVGVAMVTAGTMMMVRRRRRRMAQQPPPPSPRELLEQDRQQRGMRSDLERLMVEIEQLAKRFGSQLDAKSIQLERLLQEADQRIAKLERLQGSTAAMSWGSQPVAHSAATGQGESGVSAEGASRTSASDDPLPRRVHRLAEQGMTPEQIAKELGEHIGKVELILALRRA